MKKLIYFFFYYFSKLVDTICIPFAYLASKAGYSTIEVRNKSFGHHIWEPLALYYQNSNSIKKKKLIFLSDPNKARIVAANELLKKLGIVVENYTFLSPIYWLARSSFCGLKRDFSSEKSLKIFYDNQFENVNRKPPFAGIPMPLRK